jgi:hypothetical protein
VAIPRTAPRPVRPTTRPTKTADPAVLDDLERVLHGWKHDKYSPQAKLNARQLGDMIATFIFRILPPE